MLPRTWLRRSPRPEADPAPDALHRVIRDHLGELVARAEARGRPLGSHVLRELAGTLACGRPEGGFSWYECPDCRHGLVLPFSCKGRGFCPSCGGRRMNQLAANLVDHVLPAVPVRQWVLTFPMPVRFWLAWRPKLRTRVLSLVLAEIFGWYREALGAPRGECGSVTVWQLAGSALNLNPHIHAVVLDGVWLWDAVQERPVFRCAPRPGRRVMAGLLERIRRAVLEHLEAEGMLGEDVEGPEDDSGQLELIQAGLTGRSAQGQGPGRVRGAAPREGGSGRGPCHAWAEWFDLHARVRIGASDRAGLERLCRYIARPPLAKGRLRELPDGRIALSLKRAWDDGTTALVFGPLELLSRLAAIVPHPRHDLVVYHGVLAARHRWRSEVVPPRRPGTTGRRSRWIPWAELLKRTFGSDVLLCPVCGGRLRLRAVVRSLETSKKLLCVLGLGWHPEELRPRQAAPCWEETWEGW
jgi:hypothetical protein